MNFQKEISNLYNLRLECIWTFPYDEGKDNELILDPKCMYFEIDNKYLEICDIVGEGKIRLTIKNKITYETDMDVIYKIDVQNYILNYPEADYYIEEIGGINVKNEESGIICDALQLNLYTENYGKQSIFINSGINGVRIGGIDKKNNWIENWYIPMYGKKIEESWF